LQEAENKEVTSPEVWSAAQKKWAKLSVQGRADQSHSLLYRALVQRSFLKKVRFVRKFIAPNIFVFANRRFSDLQRRRDIPSSHESYFKLPLPEQGSLPHPKYQDAVETMFDYLAQRRRFMWDQLSDFDRATAKDHALQELDSLRSEIVDLKSQITSSERITTGWMIGAVFAYSKDIIALFPVLFIPVLLAVFGFVRFREFQRNVFDLDCYLREIELVVRPDAGWVTYFFRTRLMERFFDTRQYFWAFAIAISALLPVAGALNFLQPQAIRLDHVVSPADPVLACLKYWALEGQPSIDAAPECPLVSQELSQDRPSQ